MSLSVFELNVAVNGAYRRGAKQGLHTEHLGYLLAVMQCIQKNLSGNDLVRQGGEPCK